MHRSRATLLTFLALLLVGGWWLAARLDRPGPAHPAAVVAPPAAADPEPKRPPELFGTVERVRDLGPHGNSFLLRSTTPKTPGWDSEQNAFHRSIDMPCWVLVGEDTKLRRRDGKPAEIAVGQTVSAWCSGPMLTSNPPGWGGDFVVIEPSDR